MVRGSGVRVLRIACFSTPHVSIVVHVNSGVPRERALHAEGSHQVLGGKAEALEGSPGWQARALAQCAATRAHTVHAHSKLRPRKVWEKYVP
eukprot:6483906-Amphidinium_carterae.1